MTDNYPDHYHSNLHMIYNIFNKFYSHLNSKKVSIMIYTETLSLLKIIIELMEEYI